jgi:hypothetical protein
MARWRSWCGDVLVLTLREIAGLRAHEAWHIAA